MAADHDSFDETLEEPAGELAEEHVEEEELDPEVAERRRLALARIRRFGDPVLRTRARPVERFDAALRDEVARMGRLMEDALGIGLAATQVGVLHRLLVYRCRRRRRSPRSSTRSSIGRAATARRWRRAASVCPQCSSTSTGP